MEKQGRNLCRSYHFCIKEICIRKHNSFFFFFFLENSETVAEEDHGMRNGRRGRRGRRGREGGGRQFGYGKFGPNRGNRRQNFDIIKWENLEQNSEDILRMLAERNEDQVSFSDLNVLCMNSKKMGRILDLLEIQNSIIIFEDHIQLTEEGLLRAKLILEKHRAIESAFQQASTTLSSHKIAHILEHTLSREEIQKVLSIKQMENIHSYPLTEYLLPEGTVFKITLESENLFYKMLSLGIYPGQRIRIHLRNGVNQIIHVKDSRLAIDRIIARNIYVIP